jgi:DNA-binding response OmpR family regulator
MIKILIADDDNSLRFLISETLLLDSGKYIIYEASDGMDAYNKIINITPDIVILDVMMPKLNGYQILEKLKETTIDIPKIVMLTAKVQQEDIKKGLDLGATKYIFKPFSPMELLNIINEI